MKWIEEHQAVCNKDSCEQCYIIGESLSALSEAQEHIESKKNQPKPKVETKLVYNYRLKEWRNEVIK